jgi:hypothetical protein
MLQKRDENAPFLPRGTAYSFHMALCMANNIFSTTNLASILAAWLELIYNADSCVFVSSTTASSLSYRPLSRGFTA